MKIIITTPTEEPIEKVFDYFKKKCIDGLHLFELLVIGDDGKELRFKWDWDDNKDT